MILKASTIFREEDDYLDRAAEEACRKIIRDEGKTLFFRASDFQSLHKAVQWRVARKMLARMTSEERGGDEGEGPAIDSLYEKLVHPSSSFRAHLPWGLFLEKRYDEVSLGRGKRSPTPPFEVDLAVPGRTPIQEIGKDIVSEAVAGSGYTGNIEATPETALLDYDRLRFPLKVRNFRPGDRFPAPGSSGDPEGEGIFH